MFGPEHSCSLVNVITCDKGDYHTYSICTSNNRAIPEVNVLLAPLEPEELGAKVLFLLRKRQ